jgi:hypothetical protein
LTGKLTCRRERIVDRFEPAGLIVEIPQVVVQETNQPDAVLHLADAHGLSGKDMAEIDLSALEANASAVGHDDAPVVEGIGHVL